MTTLDGWGLPQFSWTHLDIHFSNHSFMDAVQQSSLQEMIISYGCLWSFSAVDVSECDGSILTADLDRLMWSFLVFFLTLAVVFLTILIFTSITNCWLDLLIFLGRLVSTNQDRFLWEFSGKCGNIHATANPIHVMRWFSSDQVVSMSFFNKLEEAGCISSSGTSWRITWKPQHL